MKKFSTTLLILFSIFWKIEAQQSSVFESYNNDQTIISPSNAGIYDHMQIGISYRSQWAGLEIDKPQGITASINTAISDNGGLGVFVNNSSFGVLKQTSFELAYAYRLPINIDYNLSFGMGPKVKFLSYDDSKIITIDPNDPTFSNTEQTSMVLDARLGVSLYSDNTLLSLSVDDAIENKLNINNKNKGRNKSERVFNLYGHFRLQPKTNENLAFEPSFLLSSTDFGHYKATIGLDIVYQDLIYVGGMLRVQDAFGFRAGIRAKELIIGYQYEFGTSDLADYYKGNHEFFIGARIFNDKSSQNNRWYDRHKKESWLSKAILFKKKGKIQKDKKVKEKEDKPKSKAKKSGKKPKSKAKNRAKSNSRKYKPKKRLRTL